MRRMSHGSAYSQPWRRIRIMTSAIFMHGMSINSGKPAGKPSRQLPPHIGEEFALASFGPAQLDSRRSTASLRRILTSSSGSSNEIVIDGERVALSSGGGVSFTDATGGLARAGAGRSGISVVSITRTVVDDIEAAVTGIGCGSALCMSSKATIPIASTTSAVVAGTAVTRSPRMRIRLKVAKSAISSDLR